MKENLTVICSTRAINNSFIEMIKKTSGLPNIEILIYENNNEYSLTKIYNKGLNESTNELVVFIHDDIIIKTKNWGKILLKHYNTTDYGILGVAGTKKLTETGVWWANRESMYGNVSHTDGKKVWNSEFSYNFGNRIKDVVVVDGVFFSCDKTKIKKTFDESYPGFHYYDISFCFDNFKEEVKIGVHFDISIIHKSVGEVNDSWNDNRLIFIDREVKNLPKTSMIDVLYTTPTVKIKKQPKLAIIIPTKNKVDELLIPCIESIVENTDYENYIIYVADTGSDIDEKTKTIEFIQTININREIVKLIEYDYYNFAKINNDVIKNKIDTDTELVLFCNNDIEMLNDAISILVNLHIETPKVGTVGCRLHYEDGSIQHLGISLQTNGKKEVLITHRFLNWDNENVRMSKTSNFTHGNTAAFLLMSKDLFNEIGGFNEIYSECFEDVELNLECLNKNKRNVTSNTAVCYHFESQTRKRVGEDIDLQILLKYVNKNEKIKNTFYKIN